MPGPACGGEGARAVPARADHRADGRDLVFGLDDREFVLLGLRIDAQFAAMLHEGFGERGRWRDGIPGRHRRPAINTAERRGIIAIDEDAISHRVRTRHAKAANAGEVLLGVGMAHAHGLDIGIQKLLLGAILFRDQLLDHGKVDIENRRQRADIDDVLEQLPLPRVVVGAVADFRQRHADDVHVGTEFRFRQGLGGIVEQVTAGIDGGDVLVPGLRIHRDHQIAAAAPADPALGRNAHLEPGGQALDVRRKDVARRDGHAHAQDGTREQFVGRRRARTVHVGEFDDEIVGGLDRLRHGSRPWPYRRGISACPRRRSGSVPRTSRNAGKGLRPWP